jgi:hypothetical protein
MPSGPPPLVPHYECFDITGNPPAVPPVDLVTQFGVEQHVVVGPPTRLCLPAVKNGEGDLNAPHLECFAIGGPPPGVPPLGLFTQFGPQQPVMLASPSELCVPAIKELVPPTGGLAEAPDADASSLDETASSGPSTSTYAAIGGAVVGAMLLGATAWYARRRWSS